MALPRINNQPGYSLQTEFIIQNIVPYLNVLVTALEQQMISVGELQTTVPLLDEENDGEVLALTDLVNTANGMLSRLQERINALEAADAPEMVDLSGIIGRLDALESGSSIDLQPLLDRLEGLETADSAVDGRISLLEQRTIPDIAPITQRVADLEQLNMGSRMQALEDLNLGQAITALQTLTGGHTTAIQALQAGLQYFQTRRITIYGQETLQRFTNTFTRVNFDKELFDPTGRVTTGPGTWSYAVDRTAAYMISFQTAWGSPEQDVQSEFDLVIERGGEIIKYDLPRFNSFEDQQGVANLSSGFLFTEGDDVYIQQKFVQTEAEDSVPVRTLISIIQI